MKKEAAPATTGPSQASQKTQRVKRVFDMPGQTRDTPPENDPLRRFYTSLLEQTPDSEMARRWCAMTGLLSHEDAEAWVAEAARKKGGGGSRSPSKPAPRRSTGGASTAKKKAPAAKKVKEESSAGEESSSEEEEDFKAKKRPAKKAPAPRGSSAQKKAKKVASSDEESASDEDSAIDEESDSDAEEVIPQAKQRGGRTPAAPPAARPAPPLKKPAATKRDVAFTDGGMEGSDSEDDVPLGQRMKTAA